MGNLNPLKYCFHCSRAKPRASFRTVPGDPCRRQLCAECYNAAVPPQENSRVPSVTKARRTRIDRL